MTRSLARGALHGMDGAPAGVNYRKLAGLKAKTRKPKVNKKSVKSRKVPREVRNAIKQVEMRFGRGPTKRRKGNAHNKGKRVEKRRRDAANLFRMRRAAANNAQKKINSAALNAALAEVDANIQAEDAARAAAAEAQAQALEAQAAAIRHGVHGPDPNYAPASLRVVNSPVGSYRGNGNSMGDLVGRFGRLG
jgi:hypothetical protein